MSPRPFGRKKMLVVHLGSRFEHGCEFGPFLLIQAPVTVTGSKLWGGRHGFRRRDVCQSAPAMSRKAARAVPDQRFAQRAGIVLGR